MPRLLCIVPGCRRTTTRCEFDEWLCGEHWRLLPKPARRAYGRHVRRWRRYHRASDGATATRLWGWLKRHAIERAVGIG
jgi:hypothetical protein